MGNLPSMRVLMPIALVLFTGISAPGEVTKIEIASRSDVLQGKPFGLAGPYEKIVGKVFFAVDPGHPRSRTIVDIDKAPRNARGLVSFSADLYVLAPKEPARGNGVALFDVLNRGRKNIVRDFNRATQLSDPIAAADFGDGFLMRHGFTLVWIGWQFDIQKRGGLMGMDAPVAMDQGHPVTGPVTTSFTPNIASASYPLDDMGRYADTTRYPPVDPSSPKNKLIVREGFLGAARTIPRDEWQFGRIVDGRTVPDTTGLILRSGFQPGKIYELNFEAQGAVVAGLAFAVFRDLASSLKHQPGSLAAVRYAYAFGPSQSGRFLREFLYEGFNADEKDRRVFDGVIAHIAGAARGNDFNVRFARPNGLGFFAASLFPYLDQDQKDPVTGRTDGLLKQLPVEFHPKIFYTNSSTEYWGGGRSAALTHTSLDGQMDAEIPDDVRAYLFAGTQHVPGGFLASQGEGAQKANPNEYSWGMRALLIAMDRWVREGVPPPASRHPRLSDGSLLPLMSFGFPPLPGVRPPLTIQGGYRADLEGGPASHPLPFLVPKVDDDGNEVGGIRLPEIAVPLATYTGWNFRSPTIGMPSELLPLTGSFIPFAVTQAARHRDHDPRLSIEERYSGRAMYLGMVTDAALKLIQERYVLSEDLAGVAVLAAEHWDNATRRIPAAGK